MRNRILAILFAVAVASVVLRPAAQSHFGNGYAVEKERSPPVARKLVARISVRVEPSAASVGDKIKIVEMIPNKLDFQFSTGNYRVVQIGEHDIRDGEVRCYDDDKKIETIPGGRLAGRFGGFWGISGKHDFDDKRADELISDGFKGFKHEFTPLIPGIFMIIANWKNGDMDYDLTSYPAILVVKPKS